LQHQVCNTFHYALNPGGFLFLGASERADQPAGLFRSADRDSKIFRSIPTASRQPPLPLLVGPGQMLARGPTVTRSSASNAGSEAALHRQMLERIAPPSILVDETYRAVHLSENASRFLRQSSGPVSTEAPEMVREELRFDLRTLLRR